MMAILGISLYPPEQRTTSGNGREIYACFVWQHGYEGDPTTHLFPPDICEEAAGNEEDHPRPKHPAQQVG
jgi:hypothetical protein